MSAIEIDNGQDPFFRASHRRLIACSEDKLSWELSTPTYNHARRETKCSSWLAESGVHACPLGMGSSIHIRSIFSCLEFNPGNHTTAI
ncbi:hypothetical protein BT69DRAFT_513505 [Atractiella rhizophila]|nr:hypothetical protein BT69DRAFT_513505 [Atractiella rhizophila]